MEKETKQKLRDGRNALQDNILPTKYEVIELYDIIQEQEDKLMAIKNVLEDIPDEHCTPFIKDKATLILSLIK